MPDRTELLKKLKNLNPAQFRQVLFDLNIDPSIIPDNVAQTEKAIEVIQLLEQSPDGLQQLEKLLTTVLSPVKPITTPEPTPQRPGDNPSYPCTEGYTFEGSGPGPSGEYSGWCNPISSNAGAKRYPCVGMPGTPQCQPPS